MTAPVRRGVILIVRQPGNARVLAAAAEEAEMTAAHVSTADELRVILAHPDGHWVALVDPSGFGEAAWPMCEQLHNHAIPFVVLSTGQDRNADNRSLRYGAASVLRKPVAKQALLNLLHSLYPEPGPTAEGADGDEA